MRMIFCVYTQDRMGSDAGRGSVRQVKTRIPGEATYPEAIIGFHFSSLARENASLAPLARLIMCFKCTGCVFGQLCNFLLSYKI